MLHRERGEGISVNCHRLSVNLVNHPVSQAKPENKRCHLLTESVSRMSRTRAHQTSTREIIIIIIIIIIVNCYTGILYFVCGSPCWWQTKLSDSVRALYRTTLPLLYIVTYFMWRERGLTWPPTTTTTTKEEAATTVQLRDRLLLASEAGSRSWRGPQVGGRNVVGVSVALRQHDGAICCRSRGPRESSWLARMLWMRSFFVGPRAATVVRRRRIICPATIRPLPDDFVSPNACRSDVAGQLDCTADINDLGWYYSAVPSTMWQGAYIACISAALHAATK